MRTVEVYPRVCGGTRSDQWDEIMGWGLSPRVRGNPMKEGTGESDLGSIPACAGEPYPDYSAGKLVRVYPRVCGGTTSSGCRW